MYRRRLRRPPRVASAPRGLLHLAALRELGLLAVFVAILLAVFSGVSQNHHPAVAAPHAQHPVYLLHATGDGRQLWIARRQHGVTQLDLPTCVERNRWLAQQHDLGLSAFGGGESPASLLFRLDGMVELFQGDQLRLREQVSLADPSSDAAVSEDGRAAVLTTTAGHARLWLMSDDGNISGRTIAIPGMVNLVAISPVAPRLALATSDRLFLWDYEREQVVADWSLLAGSTKFSSRSRCNAVAWSNDGAQLATIFESGMMRLWNSKTQELLWARVVDEMLGSAACFSPCGRYLATGGFDTQLSVWDLSTRSLSWKGIAHSRPIRQIAFAPDGRTLFSGGLDGRVLQWSMADGRLLREIP